MSVFSQRWLRCANNNYDIDKMFSALEFGGGIDGEVSHEFVLNGDPSNHYCASIQGVVEAYHKAIQTVELSRTTFLLPSLTMCQLC